MLNLGDKLLLITSQKISVFFIDIKCIYPNVIQALSLLQKYIFSYENLSINSYSTILWKIIYIPLYEKETTIAINISVYSSGKIVQN